MSNQKRIKLTEREKCRDKISVWYGSEDNFYHGLREAIANSVDEIHNNFLKGFIKVTLHDDCETATIRDSGRGIPIEEFEEDGTPAYELLFQVLFASTKYNNNESGETTTGVNGLGVTVLNYTSDLFTVTVGRNGKLYRIEYTDGGYTDGLQELGDTDETFTEVTFKLSKEVYTNTVFAVEEVMDIAKRFAVCCNKVDILFEHKDIQTVYHFDSLSDYFGQHVENLIIEEIVCNPTTYTELDEKGKSDTITMEMVFGACNGNTIHESYLNFSYLSEQGTIHEGIISGIRNVVNKYLKAKNLFEKDEKSVAKEDVENAISYVMSVLSTNVSYANQTKFSTEKKLYQRVAQKYVTNLLEIYEIENPIEMHKLANQVLISMRARIKSNNMMENYTKKLTAEISGISNKMEDLMDCRSKDPEKTILCLMEGKSALTSVATARDSETMACYPLRGKILNLRKADMEKIFKSEVITNIIRILGCGIDLKNKHTKEFNLFDITKLRYGKIYILVDADVDGIGSILPLLLNMFSILTPQLISDGRIYLIGTPKYEVLCEDTYYYAVDDNELKKIEEQLQGKKYKTFYVKGLGELDVDTMALCLEEDWKNKIQIRVDNFDKAMETLELWLGEKVDPRKEHILNNF